MSLPFFTIVTVTYKDAWQLSKTMQSTLDQNHDLFEYLVIDGNSNDETDDIVAFWLEKYPNKIKYIKEKDNGVYDAMNKGIKYATGQYICFMNAGDKFKSSTTLELVKSHLQPRMDCPALLGWGGLGSDVYAPWADSVEDYLMGTLGFCHQSLYVKVDLAKRHLFDDRKGKIDSDRLQLAQIIKQYGAIYLLHEFLAVRSDDAGLSANAELLKKSSIWTVTEYYQDINEHEAENILNFKYSLEHLDVIESFLKFKSKATRFSLALLALDVLVVKPKKRYLDPAQLRRIISLSVSIVLDNERGAGVIQSLMSVCEKLKSVLEEQQHKDTLLQAKRGLIQNVEKERVKSIVAKGTTDIPIALTSFPGRLASLSLVLQSLFHQTIVPKKIYLFLASSQIKGLSAIPEDILAYQKYGLEIKFVENFFQYKKYLFMKDINQSVPFITVDDDTLYPSNMVEKLLTYHKLYPQDVIGNRCHLITYNAKNSINLYKAWKKENSLNEPSHSNFATGVGGVLYPQGFVDDDSLNRKLIMKYAPYADDVWLKINALKRDIKVVATDILKQDRKAWYCGYTPEMSVDTLQDFNVAGGLNDFQFMQSLSFLPTFDDSKLLDGQFGVKK